MFSGPRRPGHVRGRGRCYPIERLRLRVKRTSEIIETHGRRRRLVGLEGIELMILDLLEMPELPADGELRLGDGQVLPIIWTGPRFDSASTPRGQTGYRPRPARRA